MKLNDSDQDLRAAFAHLRQADHAEAPAWNPAALQVVARPEHPRPASRLWLAVFVGAAACLTLAMGVLLSRPEPARSLVNELPVLLPASAETQPLLASIDGKPWPSLDAASDFLLPSHLTISMP